MLQKCISVCFFCLTSLFLGINGYRNNSNLLSSCKDTKKHLFFQIMKKKQIRHYIPLFILSTFLSFAISSCDGTKHLAEGESLLVSNRIVSSDKDYNVSSLYDYIVQKPNTKWFSTLKVPLGIYTLSGRDTIKQ